MRLRIAIAGMALALVTGAGVAGNGRPEQVRGQAVYQQWCAACHDDGPHFAGTLALRAKYQGAVEPVLVKRRDLDPAAIEYFVRNGFSVMPFFRKTEISDADMAALSAYLTRDNGKRRAR
jgi:mono/diheme cytochrome c family protein